MPSQTVDFLYRVDAALAGLYVSLVSNVDGVTKYAATTTSDVNGKWTLNPKPPAGTYALYTGAAQGVLTTLVDPDFVVDPFNDDGTAVFPKQVTISAGGLVVTAGGINVATGGLTVAAGGAAITGNTTVTGTLVVSSNISGLNLILSAAASVILPGAAGLSINNNANNAVNVGITDAGVMTVRAGIVVTAGGITVTAGGLAVTGNSTVTGTLTATGAVQGASFDAQAAGQLPIGAVNASQIAMRGPQRSLVIGNAGTAFGAGAQTLSAVAILGGEVEGVPTAASNYTFDTGANIDAAMATPANGDTFTFILANRSAGAFAITLVAAAGVTIVGNTAIAQNKVATIYMRRVGVATWGAYVTVSA